MRFNALALITSAVILGACGGGEKAPNVDSTKTAAPAPAAGAATTGAPVAGGVAAAPITGKTWEVKMVQTASGGYEFQPKDITIKEGDGIKFIVVSGVPHNIAFNSTDVPAPVQPQLSANMGAAPGELATAFLLNPGDASTISFANIPPGKYPYICQPHLAMAMAGTITVQ